MHTPRKIDMRERFIENTGSGCTAVIHHTRSRGRIMRDQERSEGKASRGRMERRRQRGEGRQARRAYQRGNEDAKRGGEHRTGVIVQRNAENESATSETRPERKDSKQDMKQEAESFTLRLPTIPTDERMHHPGGTSAVPRTARRPRTHPPPAMHARPLRQYQSPSSSISCIVSFEEGRTPRSAPSARAGRAMRACDPKAAMKLIAGVRGACEHTSACSGIQP
ncbi:hypothetical protein OH77DRAFT_287066 [Trametes cingulata]|nr:hypothetical protein OH77DRAFT_287066 [Trametes cingulata]